jgi:hypothetical protein
MDIPIEQGIRTYGYPHRIGLEDLWVPYRIDFEDLWVPYRIGIEASVHQPQIPPSTSATGPPTAVANNRTSRIYGNNSACETHLNEQRNKTRHI